MRILSIGNFTTGWDSSICDEEHIAGALENLGHTVLRQQRETGWDEALPNVDFVLLAQWDGYPEGILQNIPIPIVYWAFDYQEDGQEWHERLIAQADLYLSKPFKDSKYPNWQWLSQDFAPEFLDKVEGVQKDIDVLFTGSWVPWESGQERVAYLKAIDAQFNLQINSVTPEQWKAEGFKNVQGPVMDDALPALIARAKVNFSMDHVITPGYWSDRNAQIMACGGYVLFKYVPFSEAIFGAGIDYFYNIEDCLQKIQEALDNPSRRQTTADIGYAQATYLNRLRVGGRVWDLMKIVESIL